MSTSLTQQERRITLAPTAPERTDRPNPSRGSFVIDVFIVDDEVAITQLIADLLSDHGYNIQIFHDGASALLEIIREPPRLVLLDIGLPVMTGAEVLQIVRARGMSALPIIIMSAAILPRGTRLYGATEFLPKPFDVSTLLERVEFYLLP
jgi:two-component system, OmpR family, response regulator CpxR